VAATLEGIHVTDCNANAVMEDFPLSALSPHARWIRTGYRDKNFMWKYPLDYAGEN